MSSNNHYYDRVGICLKCDLCADPICCDVSEECYGTNWAFLSDGTIEQIALEIEERRKNG